MITEASPILSLLFAKGLGTKTLSGVINRVVEEDIPIGELVAFSADDLVQEFGLSRSVAKSIQSSHDLAARTADELDQFGVEVLVRGIEPYPVKLFEVLGDNAPPVLFVRGCLALFERKAVGFCGARNASEKGIRVAGDSARLLAPDGVNVVSGYAKGVDLAAHRAALDAGGATTIVLAEGILHFRAKREVKALLDENNHLVVSEFSPRLPWSARNAMQRNKTICGLSDAMVVIESGMKGGTFAAAESAIKLKRPLFVADYAQPSESAEGNRYFIERGATALRGDRSGRPNLARLYAALGMSTGQDESNTTTTSKPHTPVEGQHESGKSSVVQASNESPAVDPTAYPKRLIEVDLPIARISSHARREKSIRHGHISTLHIWWARRPLAACRAVICAALWPDPADPNCPQTFRAAAVLHLKEFASRVYPKKITAESKQLQKTGSPESLARWEAIAEGTLTLDVNETADLPIVQLCLLDFIADFANWDNSTVPAYLETARALTQAAHESLGGIPETRPLVVDPFAGGGSIPLEALRVGADAFASDLNPVAVLLNKVVLEFIPKYGQRLADEVRKWGQWVKEQAEQELAELYPKDPDGATPTTYLWARTINCEGPGCGAELPLLRSLWVEKKRVHTTALVLQADARTKEISFDILENAKAKDVGKGTSSGGAATCPVCGFTTPVESVRKQISGKHGGAQDGRLLAVVTSRPGQKGQYFRLPTERDIEANNAAIQRLTEKIKQHDGKYPLLPDGEINHLRGFFNICLYGITQWKYLFSQRQALTLSTLARFIREAPITSADNGLAEATRTILATILNRVAVRCTANCIWDSTTGCIMQVFNQGQALPARWEFAEMSPLIDSGSGWSTSVEYTLKVLEHGMSVSNSGTAERASATEHPLPNDSAQAVITDPPYYAAIPYADLSDFFYSWFRRTLQDCHSGLFADELVEKKRELISIAHRAAMYREKDNEWFESQMRSACDHGRRICVPSGLGVFVFANKETAAWEAMLAAMIDAGWTVTASWPIDTESGNRLRAKNSAALASSVHLVCRPREDEDGQLREEVGEWRDVLSQLPHRIHEWMPRLAAEGVVGADAIFACLGPALEIFSRYSRVEKASGEAVPLREYLEQVWAAISTEALSMIFKDADAAGLEPDARLTAMWLWTLGAASSNGTQSEPADSGDKIVASTGYTLEFDAARKIAQGLGVHLEQADSIVEVKGDKARLRAVAERTKELFGQDAESAKSRGRRKAQQRTLFEEMNEADAAEAGWSELKGPRPGTSVLDRLHQAMILFASGRGELMKRFLLEDGVSHDSRFWKLAQSLSALYPNETDEKRWVDGVLARKKGLGL